ncbi:hypothetical protein KM043_001986 [Ampulex compressa]|nr:hypothetical protein KM043_001986 [Ampulex compressa]
MTRSIKNNVTLKSTAYNQTGQTFFERLSAFNSMSSHLRRVVLAKSVIDVGNKNYVHTKPKTYKLFDNQSKLLNNSCENIIINDLSCSIHSQSLDELSVSPNSKTRIYQGDHKSRSFDKNNELSSKELNQAPVNTLSDQEIRCKKSILEMNLNYAKELKFAQDITNVQNTVLQQRDEDKQQPQKNIEQSMEKCSSKSSADDKQYSLTLSNTLLKESYLTSQKYIQAIDSQQVTDFNEEEMKYINFLYDITKEIIQSGFYTDKELEDVFDKHIEKNTGMLNMNRIECFMRFIN